MMGRQDRDQAQLFYEFNLDEVVPKDHLLRRMNETGPPRIDRLTTAPERSKGRCIGWGPASDTIQRIAVRDLVERRRVVKATIYVMAPIHSVGPRPCRILQLEP
jgi:hypothetical protein